MVESSVRSGGGRAAWPLTALFGLLALVAVFGEPLLEVRGFADGVVLTCLTPLVGGLVVALLLSGRKRVADEPGSTAGVLTEPRRLAKAGQVVEAEDDIDLEGLDLPLV